MSLAARSKTNGGTNGAKARTPELAPFPVTAPDGNGHAADPALEGAQEVELLAVRLWPVLKVTAFFATATAAVWLSALAVAWVAATSLGLTHSFQSFVRDIGFEGFQLDARPVFLAVGLLGLAWIVSIVVLAVLAAACYNAFASLCGGFRYVVRPLESRRPKEAGPPQNGASGAAARDGEATVSSDLA
jgi:hypothetical protein